MALGDNAYSRLVRWLKVLLPLSALALLSTLFLVSGRVIPEDSLPYAQVDLDQMARDQGITGPRYAGVTENGGAISLTAAAAKPDLTQPGHGTAQAITLRLDSADGRATTRLEAAQGTIDESRGEAVLEGAVRIATPDGGQITTERLEARLDQSRLAAPGPIRADMPFGQLQAGSMVLTPEDPAQQVVFNDGVKLIYRPQIP